MPPLLQWRRPHGSRLTLCGDALVRRRAHRQREPQLSPLLHGAARGGGECAEGGGVRLAMHA